MLNKNALIIMWVGNEPSDAIVEAIKDILVTTNTTVPEMLTIVYKDEDGMASSLIQDVQKEIKEIDVKVIDHIKWAVEQIGTMFADELKEADVNIIPFTSKFQKVILEYLWMNHTQYEGIFNAAKIIATSRGVIPKALAKKYHFSENICKCIKQIYMHHHE